MPNAFQVDERDGGIALVTFDVPDKKVNTLSQGVLRELAGLVGQLEQRADLRGLLLRSAKSGQFIAGADLNDLAALSVITREQAAGALGAGHQIFSRISRLRWRPAAANSACAAKRGGIAGSAGRCRGVMASPSRHFM